MKSRICWLIVVILVGTLSSIVWAEDAATVVYAEGEGFTIIRRSGDEERLFWDDPNFIGVGLADGDTILTDDRTFLELRIHARNSIVRVSENTSFEISQSGSDGRDTRLAVTYGRVRAAVQRIRGSREFEIRGQAVIAGVRGTDFGVSVLATPIGEIEDKVFVVEGQVAVQPEASEDSSDRDDADAQPGTAAPEGGAPVAEAVLVSAGNQVALRSPRDPIVVEPIDAPTRAEIERTSFRTQLPTQPAPRPAPPAPTPDPPQPAEPDPTDPGVESGVVEATGTPRSVVVRLQSGGGFVAAGGPDVYLFDRFLRMGMVLGATLTGGEPTPAAAATLAIEPRFGRLVTSLGVSGYATSSLDTISWNAVSAAVGATLGLGLEFDRGIDGLFFENTVYFNVYPNAGLPLVYMPALGLRL